MTYSYMIDIVPLCVGIWDAFHTKVPIRKVYPSNFTQHSCIEIGKVSGGLRVPHIIIVFSLYSTFIRIPDNFSKSVSPIATWWAYIITSLALLYVAQKQLEICGCLHQIRIFIAAHALLWCIWYNAPGWRNDAMRVFCDSIGLCVHCLAVEGLPWVSCTQLCKWNDRRLIVLTELMWQQEA